MFIYVGRIFCVLIYVSGNFLPVQIYRREFFACSYTSVGILLCVFFCVETFRLEFFYETGALFITYYYYVDALLIFEM